MFKFKVDTLSMTARAGIIKEAGYHIPTPIRSIYSTDYNNCIYRCNCK